MSVAVSYFDGKTARGELGQIEIDPIGRVHLQVNGQRHTFALKAVKISDRLGNTPRIFEFPDGGRAETFDNATVDRMLRNAGASRGLHFWESSWSTVLAASVVLLALLWGLIQYGLPWAAKGIAYAIPLEADELITQQTLQALDEFALGPSQLPQQRQAELRAVFQRLSGSVPHKHAFKLHFRSAPEIGPNAFALPAGTIVLFDELVEIAKNDDEIASVLAHEIGHVVSRHGLRTVLQNSAVVLLIGALTGDVLSSSSLAALLPVMLLEANYSREFEREADDFAHQMMQQHNIPLRSFADILLRMQSGHDAMGGIPGFLSSHPDSGERAEKFR